MNPQILVVGIGNIFLGDDGFGVEVVQRLSRRSFPERVQVADFGIRSIDLAYALLDGPEIAILIDAVQQGQQPGTIFLIEPDMNTAGNPGAEPMAVELHTMNPFAVLNSVRAMGGELPTVRIVGCEPLSFGPPEGAMGLSEPVAAAVDEAIKLVERIIARKLDEYCSAGPVVGPAALRRL